MPRPSAWLIRTSLLYLAASVTFGGLVLMAKGLQVAPGYWRLLPAHVEFVLLGWTFQLALGVAYWILPRWGKDRGNVTLVWAAYALLNLGVLSAAFASWLPWPDQAALGGRVLEAVAALLFAAHAWPRVKPISGARAPT